MNKILISYFSASGKTKKVALELAKMLNGDLFEIEPLNKYTLEDLDWTDKTSRTTKEMSNRSFRPEIKEKVNNIEDYNKLIIGFPVWWYTAPTIINTFLEENDISNKEVYIFVTSGGSSALKSFNDLRNMYPNINFISCKTFNDQNIDITDWIN